MTWVRTAAGALAIVVLTTGCGGNGEGKEEAEPTASSSESAESQDNRKIDNLDDFGDAISDAIKNKSFRAVADYPERQLKVTLTLGAGSDRLEGDVDGVAMVGLVSSSLVYFKFRGQPEGLSARDFALVQQCVDDRWISAPFDQPPARIMWDVTRTARTASGRVSSSGSLDARRGPTRMIDGMEATSWTYPGGDIVWAQRFGPALPLLLELKGVGTIKYSKFTVPSETVELPAPEEVLSAKDLQAGNC